MIGSDVHLLGSLFGFCDGGDLVQVVFGESLLVSDDLGQSGELNVVLCNLDELGEVPRVPLLASHGEGVEILVGLIEEVDRLNDHIVHTIDVELDLGTRVTVRQTELGLLQITSLEILQEAVEMASDAPEKLLHLCGGLKQVRRGDMGQIRLTNER